VSVRNVGLIRVGLSAQPSAPWSWGAAEQGPEGLDWLAWGRQPW
jgi:hypothetical protein